MSFKQELIKENRELIRALHSINNNYFPDFEEVEEYINCDGNGLVPLDFITRVFNVTHKLYNKKRIQIMDKKKYTHEEICNGWLLAGHDETYCK